MRAEVGRELLQGRVVGRGRRKNYAVADLLRSVGGSLELAHVNISKSRHVWG